MKRANLLITVIVGLLWVSCSRIDYERADLSNWAGSTPAELCLEIAERVSYLGEGEEDYWQAPGLTEDILTGDCEDVSILMGDLLDQMGYELHYRRWTSFERKAAHMTIEIDEKQYDPTSGAVRDDESYKRAGYVRARRYTQRQIQRRVD
jgi:hypothetical protein